MKIAAFDLSLTQAGWAIAADGQRAVGVIKRPERGMERLDRIRDRVLSLAAGADLVVLEGYSMGSKGSAFLSLAELGGLIRWTLFKERLPFVEVSPSTLKRFATGKGNAGKDEMLVAAVRRLGYEGSNNNEADALWLLLAGLTSYGAGWVEMPKTQREALHKVSWPDPTWGT